MAITFSKLGYFGRLGNQLFQIAAVLGAAKRSGQEAVFPKRQLTTFLDVSTKPREWFSERDWIPIHQKNAALDERVLDLPAGRDFDLQGFFQSERYFAHAALEVRAAILSPRLQSVAAEVRELHDVHVGEQTCSIHVRRGDYLRFTDIHPTLDFENYYRHAIARMREAYGVKRFFLVSDDLDWCRARFRSDDITISRNAGAFRDNIINSPRLRALAATLRLPASGWLDLYTCDRDLRDLMLLASCTHHIIANSSFSWWGSWLSESPSRVTIAPSQWFGPAARHDAEGIYRRDMVRM